MALKLLKALALLMKPPTNYLLFDKKKFSLIIDWTATFEMVICPNKFISKSHKNANKYYKYLMISHVNQKDTFLDKILHYQ